MLMKLKIRLESCKEGILCIEFYLLEEQGTPGDPGHAGQKSKTLLPWVAGEFRVSANNQKSYIESKGTRHSNMHL